MRQHSQHKTKPQLTVLRKTLRLIGQICQIEARYRRLRREDSAFPQIQFLESCKTSDNELAFGCRLLRKGVVVIHFDPLTIACKKCCREMKPKAKGGKLPPNFWLCPNGCNAGTAASKTATATNSP